MRALPKLVLEPLRRKPAQPARILIVHHMLLGDALLLTALIAKLRGQHPHAQLVLACPKALAPLYAKRPFGVDALAFDPRDGASVKRLLAPGSYDPGIVAGDNRYSWLALAAGCRWIVAHAGDIPAWKNWPVDEPIAYPDVPAAWAELAAELVDGRAPRPYRPADWPAPLPTELQARPYIVLHPGASSAVKRWPHRRLLHPLVHARLPLQPDPRHAGQRCAGDALAHQRSHVLGSCMQMFFLRRSDRVT